MKKLFVTLVMIISAIQAIAQQDVKGGKDHPLLTRMPDFYLSGYNEAEFGSYKFIGGDKKPITIEGHKYFIEYKLKTGMQEPGELKIRRNVQDALKKIGGTVVFDDNFNKASTIVIKKDGKETWLEIRSYNPMYRLNIIERTQMKQEISANADAMREGLQATGHIALYGIYFDFGKTELKPESDSAIVQISILLKNDTGLKLFVVGHTDNIGTVDSNMQLSKMRAEAVVNSLVNKHGISPDRLKAFGVASLAPVASNDTEEGRAKNRRVELVKQ